MCNRFGSEEGISTCQAAWQVVASIRGDLETASDADVVFEARAGCLASAKHLLVDLYLFVYGDGYRVEVGSGEFAPRQDLILPDVTTKCVRDYEKLSGERFPAGLISNA